MSSKSTEKEEIETYKDELVEEKTTNSKECQEFEGAASGEIKDSRQRKPTEKGREYKKDLLDSKQRACSSKLRKELDKIKELLDRDQPPWVSLQLTRDNITLITNFTNSSTQKKKGNPRIAGSIFRIECSWK